MNIQMAFMKSMKLNKVENNMETILKHLRWLHHDLGEMISRLELRKLDVQHIPKFWMDYVRESIKNNPEIHSEGE